MLRSLIVTYEGKESYAAAQRHCNTHWDPAAGPKLTGRHAPQAKMQVPRVWADTCAVPAGVPGRCLDWDFLSGLQPLVSALLSSVVAVSIARCRPDLQAVKIPFAPAAPPSWSVIPEEEKPMFWKHSSQLCPPAIAFATCPYLVTMEKMVSKLSYTEWICIVNENSLAEHTLNPK